ncbi:Scr1 family TA system antitoxin-like transcriptional regulator [Streptomyces sp. NPDC057717]|uniref:Scr1 family TA system antitoxin-like transcriptional regulator n=1 Tax=Streptomyces sp. NPDC057717 TaxID=3346224 RepID=UPI00369F77B3
MAKFLALAVENDPVDTRVSELTREHLREVLRLFIATKPGSHGVPFNRLSTGSLNLLVFALLTYIAELKGEKSVIFAMEEPEIALPPHAQRRLVDHVVRNMGQVIVGFPGPMPDVVLLENLIGASYVEAVDEVQIYADAFERVVASALSSDNSLALITRRMEEGTRT